MHTLHSAELFVVERDLLYFLTVVHGQLNNACMSARTTAHLSNLLPMVHAATFLGTTKAFLGFFELIHPLLSLLWWLTVLHFLLPIRPRLKRS